MLAQALKQGQADEIKLESLENGPGILPFNLGPTRIISHFHSFIQIINLNNVRNRLESVRENLSNLAPDLNNKTSLLYAPHIKYLATKLNDMSDQLLTFQGKRSKRGLINGLGSIIKSISGNLDYTDALKYENAIAMLQKNENNLAMEINHQISLSKQWASQSSNVTDRIVENQKKIEKIINNILDNDARKEEDAIKYFHLEQLLTMLGDDIDNLSQELSKLQNLLAFIKAKSIHYSVLDYDTYIVMLNKLRSLYNSEVVLDINFREYLDLLRLGYYYKDNDIILVIKFPIMNPDNYILYKLSLAPNSNNKVIIPTYPYVAIHEKDLLYIETECPKYSHGHLCEDSLNRHYGEQTSCIQHLILQQHLHETCRVTQVILSSQAMEQLDDRHYVLSFPNLTKVHLTCFQDQYRNLHGSYLAEIPQGCALQTSIFTVTNHHDQVKGQVLKNVEYRI